MTQNAQQAIGLALLARAVNVILTAEGAAYRVTADDIIMSRKGGYTLIALPETRDAADYRHCAPPYSTMESNR